MWSSRGASTNWSLDLVVTGGRANPDSSYKKGISNVFSIAQNNPRLVLQAGVGHPEKSKIQNSKIQTPKSKIQIPKSRLQSPKILVRVFLLVGWILDLSSCFFFWVWILEFKSWSLDFGSWTPWILNLGLWGISWERAKGLEWFSPSDKNQLRP